MNTEDLSTLGTHVELTLQMLEEGGLKLDPEVLEIISHHHESFDRSGYPRGIAGNELSDLDQITSIANFWDELTCGKVDGNFYSPAEALLYLFSDSAKNNIQRWNQELTEELKRALITN